MEYYFMGTRETWVLWICGPGVVRAGGPVACAALGWASATNVSVRRASKALSGATPRLLVRA